MLDGYGGRSTGGSLISVTAGGQPGSVGVSSGGALTHYAGFLGCVTLLPSLDTDGDGVADEIDPDNDNDDLSDLVEAAGDGFNPNTVTDINDPDSDDDGTTDGDESVAMTNPQDGNAFLHITEVDVPTAGAAAITWAARGGQTYRLYAQADLVGGAAALVTNVTAAGGAAPWFETTAVGTDPDATAADHRVYIVEVAP